VFRTLATMGAREALELGLPCRRIDGALAELRTAGAVTTRPIDRRRGPIWQARPPAEVVAAPRHRRLRLVDQDEQVRSHHAVVTAIADRRPPGVTAIGGELGDRTAGRRDRRWRLSRLCRLRIDGSTRVTYR